MARRRTQCQHVARAVSDTLETVWFNFRHPRVDEAATYRQLWTERDPRVPPHRKMDPEGRLTVEDFAAQIRAEREGVESGILTVVTEANKAGHRRLWAGVWAWNVVPRRVLKKFGFRETGQVEHHAVYGDNPLTVREF